MITIHWKDTYIDYDALTLKEKEEISKLLTIQAMTHIGYVEEKEEIGDRRRENG